MATDQIVKIKHSCGQELNVYIDHKMKDATILDIGKRHGKCPNCQGFIYAHELLFDNNIEF